MRTIKIYCKECEKELTHELTETNIFWTNGLEFMLDNQFSILLKENENTKSVIVPIANYYLKDHSDKSRFQGCCGSSGLDGLNKLCLNGHEVATEFSDCWTDEYIEFDNNKVIIKEKDTDNNFKKWDL
ncbi:hypothetical protein [Flavobacterium limi]|nr:hypothetical protein [Flavobacterium limi]